MNKLSSSPIGGITGAVAINLLHQVFQRLGHDAPRVDLVGEEGLSKLIEKAGGTPPTGTKLFTATLAADIVSNGGYYSLIGFARKKHLLIAGVATGLAAGIGALTFTKPMGLSDAPVTHTDKTKLLTVAWYTFGGIVAASVIKALRK